MPLSARDLADLQTILRGKALDQRYSDVVRFLQRAGWVLRSTTASGSHRVWIGPGGGRIMVKDDGKRYLLPAYVKDAIRAILAEEGP
jgi:predicted RNA binding protein YcfA (HicA-like mRNA interferase family)